MQVIELTALSLATRRGYLVRSGEALGRDDRSLEVFEDDDVVIDEIELVGGRWLVRYHPVHVAPR